MNKITDALPHHIKRALYVDDFTIFSSNLNLQTLESNLQTSLNTISRWLDKNGFTLSKEKTVMIHFKNNNYNLLRPKLQIKGSTIPLVESHKFLGITFDERLTYTLITLISSKTVAINPLTFLKFYPLQPGEQIVGLSS